MKPTKYLILLNNAGEEIPVVFDGRLSHKDVAAKMGMKVVSAGAFIVISGYATGGGGSMTLNIMESRPQDMDIIRKLIGAK
jgi:hypothetical protein